MVSNPKSLTANDDDLIAELSEIVGDENILSQPEELLVYECDGLPQHKHLPRAVVFPASTEETSEVLSLLAEERISFAPRGAGTGLSGGALAVDRGVVIEMARMRDILRIDPENQIAVVQTGLVNAQLSRAVAHYGLYYVPDPSSQPSCTIGGNIAENAGGIHCLKYGTTTDHVIGVRVVLSDGSVVDLASETSGYDLRGVFVGSEGTFGIATEATLRLTKSPQAIRTLLADFTDVDDASRSVSAVIAAGVLPAALEMMDHEIIRAVEASVFAAGLPTDARAVLLVELDGVEAGIDDEAEKVGTILREHGARSVRSAADENERKKLWAARKGAFGAVGRLSPDIMIQDAVVPRSRLPEVLAETYRISAKHKLQLANVFHAGDGNLHPLICFDQRRGDDLENVRQAGREIMETCVRAGGSITGEHGVGLDKSGYLPLIFSEDDMSAMLKVRAAFDPSGLCNPGKIIPTPKGCGEARAVATIEPSDPRRDPASLRELKAAVTENPSVHQGGKTTGLADRISEVKVANEFKRMIGGGNVIRLSETSFAKALQSQISERTLVIAPETSNQIAQVVRLAGRGGLSVIPAGGATSLDTGNLLKRADIILTTRRLAKIIRHEPADLVATAEAGVTLSDFQKVLGGAGQWLPIDSPANGRTTLGGVVAAGLRGAQSFGYGLPRSFVIGMRTVLADGRSIKAGGQVVKNVAGYDLSKLFTGSYGTLGLITAVTFKLRPLPAETRTVVASGPPATLIKAGRNIASKFSAVAIELMSARMARQIRIESSRDTAALLIRFAGSSRAVVTQTALTLKLLREDPNHRCATHDEDNGLWSDLAGISLEPSADLVWRAAMHPTDLVKFLDEMSALEQDDASHPNLSWHAGLGDGHIRAISRAPVYHREAVRALEGLRQKAENLGGHLVIEKAPVEIKSEVDSWGSFGSATELMKQVKRQLDPENLLSPGRFF